MRLLSFENSNYPFPIGRAIYPGGFYKMEELGLPMINATAYGSAKKVLKACFLFSYFFCAKKLSILVNKYRFNFPLLVFHELYPRIILFKLIA